MVCRDKEGVDKLENDFSWIYDLCDRQCKEVRNIFQDVFPSLLQYSHVVHNQILRLCKQLSELQ